MKRFTDIFVCRPVLASVISLFFIVLGFRAYLDMQVRQYPQMSNTKITITTTYPGASADVIEGFITKQLEQSVAGAEGVDYISSTSMMGTSTIEVYVKNDFDPNVAFTDVNALVQSEVSSLPSGSQLPTIVKQTGSSTATMYLNFESNELNSAAVSDYLLRVVKPKLFTVPGISSIEVMGGSWFSMRIWLNSAKMAAYHITMEEVQTALTTNNVQSAAGTMKGDYVQVDIQAKTDTASSEEFENIIIKKIDGALIHLKDIAKVDLGKEDYDINSMVLSNKTPVVVVAIYPGPEANTLDISAGVNALFPEIEANLPDAIHLHLMYDSSQFVHAAIGDVLSALWEAVLIVMIVILLFLGAFRSIIIPVITIPLSLVGTFFVMQLLGYSINLMTLLAFVVAVSLVVDDAIVVMENIYRHLEEGASAFKAALHGAREIAFPVIVMTFTLLVVYLPIGMMGGITGSLFREFAFTLAATVLISGVLALTLSPMMCSKIIDENTIKLKMVQYVDKLFHRFRQTYQQALTAVLNYKYWLLFLGLFVMANSAYFFMQSKSELAPQEDQGVIFAFGTAPQYASLNYDIAFAKPMAEVMEAIPERKGSLLGVGIGEVSSLIGVEVLKDWDERPNVSASQIQYTLQKEFSKNAGFMLGVTQPPALPTGGKGFPISFHVVGSAPIEDIYVHALALLQEAKKSGLFALIYPDIFINRPQLVINVDRSKAAMLGISMADINTTLATAMGGNYTNYFNLEKKAYKVIPQVQRRFRLTPELIGQMRIATDSGKLVPLSSVVTFSRTVIANHSSRFQQQNSVALFGVMMPGHTLGEGLNFLINTAKEILPKGVGYDTSGSSRQYLQEGDALLIAFALAIIIIFLVLGAQFESFRDPLIILISVPMSVFGALLPIYFGLASINVYTEVGILTLIGLISKHGILIVQFANNLRVDKGMSKLDAIIEASSTRLRPILMTTAAMVFGMLPLVFSSGAGAVSSSNIGMVISCGMLVGTCFTLFVLPAFYLLLSGEHKPLLEADD